MQAQVPSGQPGQWDLVFNDEFQDSTLNLDKWEPSWFAGSNISNPINSDEDGCYSPNQISLSNGLLNLTAVATNQDDCFKRDNTQAHYVSGLINSRNSYLFTYGYIEARINFPGNSGSLYNWPAFWTDGTGKWPSTGEIDIVEALSGHQPCWHYHYLDTNNTHQSPGGCVDWSDPTGWHTYAAHWEPGVITYYYDEQVVGTITIGVVDAPHYIILNYGINDRYGINVPSTMTVDYVRVWKQSAITTTPTPLPSLSPTPTPTPPPKPGDGNGDNLVDESDFSIWLTHYLQQITGVINGDFSGNSFVDGVDYVIWLNNYGN